MIRRLPCLLWLAPPLVLTGCATNADVARLAEQIATLRKDLDRAVAVGSAAITATKDATFSQSAQLTNSLLRAIGGHALAADRYLVEFDDAGSADTWQRTAERFAALTQHQGLEGAAFRDMLAKPYLPLRLDFERGLFTTPAGEPRAINKPAASLPNADTWWWVIDQTPDELVLDCSVTRPGMKTTPYLRWHLAPRLNMDRATFGFAISLLEGDKSVLLARGLLIPIRNEQEGL